MSLWTSAEIAAATGGTASADFAATGVTFDGVQADGTVNRNSGAESTIHGLLAMIALDAHPTVSALAQASAKVSGHEDMRVRCR